MSIRDLPFALCTFCRTVFMSLTLSPFDSSIEIYSHKYKELHDQGIRVAEGPQVKEVKKKPTKWTPPKRSAPPPSFKPNVLPSAHAEVKASDWRKALKERPKPDPLPPRPKVQAPPPPETESQQEVPDEFIEFSGEGMGGGPVVLLDETVTFSNKKPKAKKDKKEKKKKDKKKSKKTKKKGNCVIM